MHIEAVLQRCGWRINGRGNAAERLGVHPNTLRFRMKKLGVAGPADRARSHAPAECSLQPSDEPPGRRRNPASTGCIRVSRQRRAMAAHTLQRVDAGGIHRHQIGEIEFDAACRRTR